MILSGMRRIALKVCFFVGFALTSGVWLHAQTTHGAIKVQVTDPNGAVVPGAKVVLRRQSTKETFTALREVKTDSEGEYEFSEIPLGIYEVKVLVNGFAREFTKRIELTSKQPIKVDVVFSFAPCSDEREIVGTGKLTDAEHSEIVHILVGLLIGDVHPKASHERRIILSPDNFSPEWLSTEQRLRTSILTRTAIQELTERMVS